jgi:hypothetical protein
VAADDAPAVRVVCRPEEERLHKAAQLVALSIVAAADPHLLSETTHAEH